MNARREQKGEESGGASSHPLIAKGRGVNVLEQEDVHSWVHRISANIKNARLIRTFIPLPCKLVPARRVPPVFIKLSICEPRELRKAVTDAFCEASDAAYATL